MGAEVEVQRALYDALSLLGLRVYDSAPQAVDGGSNATFPYVEVGTVAFAPWDTSREQGHDFVARIHTRSRSASMMETKTIQGQIYTRLHLGLLTIVGHDLILIRREASDVIRAPDGSFHGVCEYRGLIEQA